jgi:hypothetical protein
MSTETAPAAKPVFTLNGTQVPLEPQDRSAFMWLASQAYRRIHEGPPIPATLTVLLHEGTTTQGLPTTDSRIQAILWTLWQLGISGARVEGEGEQRTAKWDRGTHANIDTRPVIEHFTEEGILEGRALASAFAIANSRSIRINGNEVPVRISNMALLQAQSAEIERRRTSPSHDPAMAAASYVAELLSGGSDQNDLRLRAALEIAADLGIRSMVIDAPSRQLRVDGFSEQAALAVAFLQGAPVDEFKVALGRVQALNRLAADQNRMLLEKAGGKGPEAERARAVVSASNPAMPAKDPFRRRRR